MEHTENSSSIPLNEEDSNKEHEKSITSYTLIETINQTIDVVSNILLKEEILAIDCEGVELSKKGRLTLIQV